MTTTVAPSRSIGQSLRRNEDVRFLRGTAMYLDDLELPASAAHVAFVRSRHAHADVLAVDAAAALAIPGVLRVFTADDLPDAYLPTPLTFIGVTVTAAPHPVFAGKRVRYMGQVIAAVVATSRALAEDGADAVDVTYAEREPVLDVRAAQNHAIQLHDHIPGNVYVTGGLGTGDVSAAFAAADVRVARSYHIPRVAMSPMETRGAIASYDRGTETLTLWASAQDVHRPRFHVSHALKIPEDKIHVILPDVGGAFGQKQVVTSETVAVAFAAMSMGVHVKWMEDRLENLVAAPQGRGVDGDLELALTRDGTILAIRGTVFGDMGAYSFVNGVNGPHTTANLLSGVYAIPAADIHVRCMATNKVPTNPYRGAGRPEAAIMLEQLIDEAARELQLDPIALRRRNLIQAEAMPYQTALGFVYDSGNYPALLERVLAMANIGKMREDQTLARLEGRVVGVGVAFYVERSGGYWESAAASIEPDGRIIARTGSGSHGQGHETSFAQVAADVIGVCASDISLRWRDSGDVPRGVGTFGSRAMTMGGNALNVAMHNVRRKGSILAAALLKTEPEAIVWENGTVRAPDGTSLTLAELATAAYNPALVPAGFEIGLYCTGHFASAFNFTAGAHVVGVEINRRTGRITMSSLYAVDDAGTIVNPLLAEGQVIGAAAQGIGEAICEEVTYDESGRPLSSTFLDYNVMTAANMPTVVSEFMQTPSPLNPLGIKGVGEGGCCGAPAAIANAVADALALTHAPHIDIPFTEEKLWRALQTSRAL
jgi:carbon-monoxide dehydrogenase large subunit